MLDFILFRRMLTPLLIQILFWIGLLLCLITGIADFFNGEGWVRALQVLIIGPIVIRMICEVFILFFRINATLTEIKNLKSASLSNTHSNKDNHE